MNFWPSLSERRRLFRLVVRSRKCPSAPIRPIPSLWRRNTRLSFWWTVVSFCFAEPWLIAFAVLSLPAWVWLVLHKMMRFNPFAWPVLGVDAINAKDSNHWCEDKVCKFFGFNDCEVMEYDCWQNRELVSNLFDECHASVFGGAGIKCHGLWATCRWCNTLN